jgi:hypothetical protein
MPTSHLSQLSTIVEVIVASNPNSMLDVGAGFGKYGVLAREYLDVADVSKDYHLRKHRIDGIEAFREYLTPLHDYVYDKILVGDAREIVPKLTSHYDLILLIDVIEHLSADDGRRLISDCLKAGTNILISTPNEFCEQHDTFGNPFEIHQSHWKRKDFVEFGSLCFIPDDVSLICFIGADVSRIRGTMLNWKRRMKLWVPFLIRPYRLMKRLWRG